MQVSHEDTDKMITIYIDQFEDHWFLVLIQIKVYPYRSQEYYTREHKYYKCDQLEGLLETIKNYL